MKFLVYSLVAGLFFAGSFAQADAPNSVNHLPERAFLVNGFDDNDNSEVVIDGSFPNTCFKVGPTSVKVDQDKKQIVIDNKAYYFPKAICLMMLVPYTKTIELGTIAAGSYSVAVKNDTDVPVQMGLLNIKSSASRTQDDHLYAPVQHVRVERPASGGTAQVVLTGSFSNTCMSIKEVSVQYDKDTVVVLPITEMKGLECESQERSFETRVNLREGLKGRTLIHVRSLNGQAINTVVNF